MYFLQGLLVGLATFAPVGMQNLFIINTALVQPDVYKRQSLYRYLYGTTPF